LSAFAQLLRDPHDDAYLLMKERFYCVLSGYLWSPWIPSYLTFLYYEL